MNSIAAVATQPAFLPFASFAWFKRELALLEFLLRRRGEAVPKREILQHVWDDEFEGDPNIVEVYVRHLRNKLDRPFGRAAIQTVRGTGYRLVADGG